MIMKNTSRPSSLNKKFQSFFARDLPDTLSKMGITLKRLGASKYVVILLGIIVVVFSLYALGWYKVYEKNPLESFLISFGLSTHNMETNVGQANPFSGQNIQGTIPMTSDTGTELGKALVQEREKQGGTLKTYSLKELKKFAKEVNGHEVHAVLQDSRLQAEKGGNDLIVETFLERTGKESATDLTRMLSYIDATHPLSHQSVQDLIAKYSQSDETYSGPNKEVISQAILNTLSRSGGDEGVEFVIGQLDKATDDQSWKSVIETLGRSGSTYAFEYLHKLLDNMVTTQQSENDREHVRQAILQLKKELSL